MQGEEVHEHNSVPAIALMEREEEAEKEQECFHCAHCNVTLGSLWNLTRHEGSKRHQNKIDRAQAKLATLESKATRDEKETARKAGDKETARKAGDKETARKNGDKEKHRLAARDRTTTI